MPMITGWFMCFLLCNMNALLATDEGRVTLAIPYSKSFLLHYCILQSPDHSTPMDSVPASKARREQQ
ncbi:hypothetical protein I315_02102 [Cryptococcus gattii Ru294]|uniref:Secreted protein n=2 Tax=Cryptococcus gattii TaxID=37769 RepID=E6R365_CRYGW|nr:Hypothetical Protein CGB_C3170C [Cryptococcus gattii WM276]KIR55513.1 hypothetical protein I315_02102 [Cryptococcus gattii Ru294]KIR82101.1 hypothetical protein I306_00745 [Cryptococcus gattii EJB2]KIY31103.1 hypothetical protein I305_06392 [Cryptococcus gattii E566]KJE02047.1 hypothetical protein I311_04255 [Cryptococcus gattii NT-10]ADV20985.1 Hypothetical Protein CGB_C3170C [Cryptococcus gattii WM276]